MSNDSISVVRPEQEKSTEQEQVSAGRGLGAGAQLWVIGNGYEVPLGDGNN